jgi:hypothetical protein
MSTEQREIFDLLTTIIDNPSLTTENLEFITGKAGRGKSFVVDAVVAHVHSTGRIALVMGTTALCVANTDRGQTAHYLCKIPVTDDYSNLKSLMDPNGSRADLFRQASVVVWDELPMAHRAVIEAVDTLFKAIMDNNLPFGGKVLIGLGDFRQVAPVVPGGGETATYLASLLSSSLWRHFHFVELLAPIRNACDPDFSKFVDNLGEDPALQQVNIDPFIKRCPSLQQAQDLLFPTTMLAHPETCVKRAFLTPLNTDVDRFNTAILDRLMGPTCK